MTPSLDTGCRVGVLQFRWYQSTRIRFGPTNRVRSKKGCYSLVVLEHRFRRLWKSLGLGGFRIEYMIEKHVFSNVLV